MKYRLVQLANSRGIPMSHVVRAACAAYLDNPNPDMVVAQTSTVVHVTNPDACRLVVRPVDPLTPRC
jgi:hypothetical protein